MTRIKICNLFQLGSKNYFIKWMKQFKDEVIVYRDDKKIYIKSSICPHFGGPITYNQSEKLLYCYWHGLKFSLDGKCSNQKSFKACLNNYDFELEDNYIYIKK